MVSMWLTDSRTKDSSADDQALEQLLNDVKKRVNGTRRSSDDEEKGQIEIERIPVDDDFEHTHRSR